MRTSPKYITSISGTCRIFVGSYSIKTINNKYLELTDAQRFKIDNIDGKNLERVTHSETFDAFPVFSNDGKKLIFSSNRNNGGGRDTNLFIAEWQD